jgi:hypothetical protein
MSSQSGRLFLRGGWLGMEIYRYVLSAVLPGVIHYQWIALCGEWYYGL